MSSQAKEHQAPPLLIGLGEIIDDTLVKKLEHMPISIVTMVESRKTHHNN